MIGKKGANLKDNDITFKSAIAVFMYPLNRTRAGMYIQCFVFLNWSGFLNNGGKYRKAVFIA